MLPEVAKSRLKPCVDIAHSELLILRLNNGLKEQRTKNKESVWHWGNDGSTITHKKSEIEEFEEGGLWWSSGEQNKNGISSTCAYFCPKSQDLSGEM